jgi:hypothetical protein
MICSELVANITVRSVVNAPSTTPCFSVTDDNYLRTAPGLYPDILSPVTGTVRGYARRWNTLWIDVEPDEGIAPGIYSVAVSLCGADDGELCSTHMNLQSIGAHLPEQRLIHTEWFHADCLADFYKVEVFSEQHWAIVSEFMKTAARRGINMIFTPIFTQPIDTARGTERTTVQLTDVFTEDGGYRFGFDRLGRWIDTALDAGFTHFEISHLFTQGGANAAPKIVNQNDERIFDWHTEATSEPYATFLKAFIPCLLAYLKEKEVLDHCYFHISDEPPIQHLEQYRAARDIVADLLKGCRIIDACSIPDFYESGIIDMPVVLTGHYAEFEKYSLQEPWVYFCCGPYIDASNRFFAMPSSRNRIIGVQLYLAHIAGFLHWGYNFYNTGGSLRHINPFEVTDAGGDLPSGDAFVVYPGADGRPLESIRLMVFAEALYDLRALELLESLTSREFTESLIHDGLSDRITFTKYPKADAYILTLRQRVNSEIQKRL